MNHDIVVAAEQRDGIVQKISFELIHGAAEVAGQTGGRVITVIAGLEIKETAEQLDNCPALPERISAETVYGGLPPGG